MHQAQFVQPALQDIIWQTINVSSVIQVVLPVVEPHQIVPPVAKDTYYKEILVHYVHHHVKIAQKLYLDAHLALQIITI